MLTVVYVLCAVIGAFLILNAVLVITLHRINNKLAKKQPLVSVDSAVASVGDGESPGKSDKEK